MPAFISLKDHKANFMSSHPCRLINSCKSELGKTILEKTNNALMIKSVEGFQSIIFLLQKYQRKSKFVFIQLDIIELYNSITNKATEDAPSFVLQHAQLTQNKLRLIKHCRKCLLYDKNESWKKNTTNSCFDVTMRSYNGAEISKLIGTYILSTLVKFIDKNDCTSYHDDGLILLKNTNG